MVRKKIIKKIVRKKITGKTKLGDLMRKNPESAEILFDTGLHCVGCGMASSETIEQGCMAHGMNKKDIDNLLKKLNKEKK